MKDLDELLTQANELLDRGQIPKSREIFEYISKLDGTNAEAWLMLGAIDSDMGRLEDAEINIQRALESDPNYEEAHLSMAGIKYQQGLLEAALKSCSRALEIAPDFEEAWLMQSGIQGRLGHYLESEESSRRAIELWPDSADAYSNLGNALKARGKWQEAIDSYQRSIKLQPNMVDTYQNLGYLFLECDRLDEASKCFYDVLQREPMNTQGNLGMAKVCLSRRDTENAIAYCQTAIKSGPDESAALLTLCEAYLSAGLLEYAEDVYSRISGNREGNAADVLMYTRILESKGEYQQALGYLNSLKGTYVDNADFVIAFADLCLYTLHLNEGVELAKALLDQPIALPVSARKKLHFSLGRLYDAKGEYDKAFGHFKHANELKPEVFDQARHATAIDRLIKTYSAGNIIRLDKSNNNAQLPVFIVGLPRSGTTLVEQILCSHPAVIGAGELPYIGLLTVSLAKKLNSPAPYPECVTYLNSEILDTLAEDYLLRLRGGSKTASRITDKQNGNYLHLGLIQLLFPQARVIHCRRDPMDVCLSLFTHDMGGETTYTRTFEDLSFYFNQYQRLMAHWESVLDIPIFELQYEQLVSDQEGKTKALLEFCGLPWNDRCLNFHQTNRVVATPSHAQVRKPLYKGAVGRWRNYKAQLSALELLLGPGNDS